MGYNQSTWDADAKIKYDSKTFFQLRDAEKAAAMYLGMNPIASKLNNAYWKDLDKITKTHAEALGWTQDLWDKDYELEHLEINKMYWGNLTKKQQKAAKHFGYTKGTWDETWETTKRVAPNKKVEATNETDDDSVSPLSFVDCCTSPYKALFWAPAKLIGTVAGKA